MEDIKNIYLIAICGTGMAALAGLLKGAGHRVSGSDANIYPPMSTLLENAGIPVLPGYRKENITSDIDLVIVGNAVSKTNEEVQAVLDAGLEYTSFPEALAHFFLVGRKSLVVTGTHGKTTTTSLLSWVLQASGRKPGFMVGGWLKNFDNNHQVPEGDYFVTEGDEYDSAFFDKGPKFLHYRPDASILTGIEFDHADIFEDLDQIKDAFRKYVSLIRPDGVILVRHADANIQDVLGEAVCRIETYGYSEGADWRIEDYRFEGGYGFFSLNFQGKKRADFQLAMIGRHNVENAAAVAALCLGLGLTPDEINAAFKSFQGIKRRQEVVGVKNGVTVLDDFAHHPTAIRLTLEAVKEAYPGQRLWAVFEPRSATSRRKVFEQDFPDSFLAADQVVFGGPFASEKIKKEDRLDPERVVDLIRQKGVNANFIAEVDDIVAFIAENVESGDVVLVMSSGGFGGIHQKILDQ
ncbi:MAG: UDP-N-acetylmuramate:L-alanyl-gamma-D-glutamyl-meso-diaminopimelate ligase [Nitrospina sp.]|jgi:UDP-N-acetylmuramate: L-alanyl-gamma-D-glutamyl-meso-diaminopimelate ligase|nr:UDP-N-acetylmuramate:L-alanyl-gamma-D-glutamyl-meso-diaminopimelate ligase [Nitrospina sp.]MBT3875706.1 UDP-N-acetylmuramate:L-alanyl-gamma-D-glutamyl-meso-diaminopimelate ligase [Nitrospina sp.]MBT4049633.1 UDP-N-acetylmuramate:L-alanyl-gamma-D-glutamyl-meso-diaminopimelate ligase [Nitrospina sp.]MBT4558345.1 UDP-N-acetylmuramate:L-alanyl-gamma-D-glutamyl-meso-diaminopimelate ligase [Nitrospina sp.]MBT5348075.1 UDP-N-acetylmuramate:L-alanyl-gamma-D-glutamyl-meso-diaminopimelate ligase [Nitr